MVFCHNLGLQIQIECYFKISQSISLRIYNPTNNLACCCRDSTLTKRSLVLIDRRTHQKSVTRLWNYTESVATFYRDIHDKDIGIGITDSNSNNTITDNRCWLSQMG